MIKYRLLTRQGIDMKISIAEDMKEEFKEMMGWSEEMFQEHTIMFSEEKEGGNNVKENKI